MHNGHYSTWQPEIIQQKEQPTSAIMRHSRRSREGLTWIPPVCQVSLVEQSRLQPYIRPVDGVASPGLFFRTLTLLREKQGKAGLDRPLGRNLVIVIEGIVSGLNEQVDRLLTELHDFPYPRT